MTTVMLRSHVPPFFLPLRHTDPNPSSIHLSPSSHTSLIGYLLCSRQGWILGVQQWSRAESALLGQPFSCLLPCFPSMNIPITQQLLNPSYKDIFLLIFSGLSYIYCFQNETANEVRCRHRIRFTSNSTLWERIRDRVEFSASRDCLD